VLNITKQFGQDIVNRNGRNNKNHHKKMSEIAKKLIAKNLKKKEKTLDLGKCGLTDLNLIPELFDCTHLEELILSDDWMQYDSAYYNYVLYRTRNTKKPNKIASFPPQFARLTHLKTLRAERIGLENIDTLGDMPQLEYVAISGGTFKEMNCLQNLKNLLGLDISSNFYLHRDYSILQSLSKLKFLDISANTVNNRDFLGHLTNLSRLHIHSLFSLDITPLENLHQLIFLLAGRNQIEDISALKNLTQLETLFLRSNRIEKIDSLENLQKLRFLNLESNKIADISPLQNLKNLESLELTSNQIKVLSPLQNLTLLTRLTLENNQIQDIGVLKNLNRLLYLDLGRNQIEDISTLQDLRQLTNLYFCGNKIRDIKILENLKALEALDLRSNQLDDQSARFLTDKNNLPNLRYLYLSHNPFQNIPEAILKLNEVQLLSSLRAFLAQNG
jgi:internalin A